MRKTKIAHIITGLKIGGAESLLVDYVRNMQNEAYWHVVIYFQDGPNVEHIKDLGIPAYQVQGLLCNYDPLFWWRLYRLLKQINPDLIHSSLWAANFAARIIGAWMLKIPTLCTIHLGIDEDGRVRNLIDRFSFRAATRIVAISDDVAKTLRKKQFWFAGKTIRTIQNGIDVHNVSLQNKHKNKSRGSISLAPNNFVIGTVGRFIPRKNYTLLLRVFAKIQFEFPFARLLLLGYGPQEVLLRSLAKNLGIEDKVLFIIGQKPFGYYPLLDCFVLPSLQEGLSIALLEAMSSCLPCIISHTNRVHEVIKQGENGFLVPTSDEKSLHKAIHKCITDEEKRKKIANKAFYDVQEHFSMKSMADQYAQLYREMLKNK